ncbi:tetratricopeptide repeat protein [Reichenbachiella agariperforans]|uniref:tetratricopeptide repeat protein n=1 Tax=Reichenbachiella agariperforans TaxID=156994 RepID=UPI001C08A1DA|nr:tetratricopeptide repeat protein [Reichenbachiella agariperforans]MBU2914654.1 tetratricopeptide repeat protein [Reichenbachiella agariperforans]
MKKFLSILALIIPLTLVAQDDQNIQLANEYYLNGDYEKAKDLYDELAKSSQNIPNIHNNYLDVLLSLNDYKAAEKYLKVALKSYPSNVYYQIDEGILYTATDRNDQADKKYKMLITEIKENGFLVRTAAQYFISKQLANYALDTYIAGRQSSRNKQDYALELANTYRVLGQKEEMLNEYLVFASLRPQNLRYVKNILQNLLQSEEDIQYFQNTLLDNIQKNPSDKMYADLLIWAHVQQKDFHGAFIQARAINKRMNENGYRLINIGEIALKNESYADAEEIFTYIVDKLPESQYNLQAQKELILARQEKVKRTFPVDKTAIRQLTHDYHHLMTRVGLNQETIEAYRQKALLHAFYLDEKDSAIQILNEIISIPRVNEKIKSLSKLDLGDIYLLIDQPWESTLLYAQVEKANKSSKIGYEAKFKNARLNYYMGNFELAKSHLDILKTATTKEIANDAIALSLLIQNNTALDTSDFVLKKYADIDLLMFQHKTAQAKRAYQQMLEDYPAHSLVDEIHWQLAQIYLSSGEFENSILQLEVIQLNYATDLFGDDASFLEGKILEEYLMDKEGAMEVYKNFLIDYPGSIYVSDARKRFRKLRGDSVYQ